jgi:hypothetical protein
MMLRSLITVYKQRGAVYITERCSLHTERKVYITERCSLHTERKVYITERCSLHTENREVQFT